MYLGLQYLRNLERAKKYTTRFIYHIEGRQIEGQNEG